MRLWPWLSGAATGWPDADPVVVTRRGMAVVVLLLFALVRCVHLGQAVIDVAVGARVYTRPVLAVLCAGCCVAESGVLLGWSWMRGRLELGAMLGDAMFGLVGLGVLSVAMAQTQGRLDTLNWMLPYTVGTGVGLAFALAADRGWGGRRLAVASVTVAVLAAGYLVSVLLPHRLPDETTQDLAQNMAGYPVFFVVSVMLAAAARRRVATVVVLTGEVTELAARTAREAVLASLTAELFSPVLDVMDRVAADPADTVSQRPVARQMLDRIDDLATSIEQEHAHG
jgi:hypothetical protein